MNEPAVLVEHCFRHEYGRMVASLTRSFGVRHLHWIEDAVQQSLSKALIAWGHHGIPNRPQAWLLKTARHLVIDRLRRQQAEARIIESRGGASPTVSSHPEESILDTNDDSLHLLFLCCHEANSLESRVALALKLVGGFSTREIANALLLSFDSAEKRLTRAKSKLREIGAEVTDLQEIDGLSRLDSVLATLYLLFNEGYASTSSVEPLRWDICLEAIRLAECLLQHPSYSTPTVHAILALFCMHVGRFQSRLGANGNAVLLEHQDRSQWDWNWIRKGMSHLALSAKGDLLSRYHLESAIAWEHCRCDSFQHIDWQRIAHLYQALLTIHDLPMIRLNYAIAIAYGHGPQQGLSTLESLSSSERARIRPWWDCAVAEMYWKLGKRDHAKAHWTDALALATHSNQRAIILEKLASLSRT